MESIVIKDNQTVNVYVNHGCINNEQLFSNEDIYDDYVQKEMQLKLIIIGDFNEQMIIQD